MHKKEFYIAKLIVRFLNGQLNEKGRDDLDSWLEKEDNKRVFQKVTNKQNLLDKSFIYDSYNPDVVWSKIEKEIRAPFMQRKFIRYAAAIIVPLAFVLLGVHQLSKFKANQVVVQDFIHPGETDAILHLASGEVIDLKNDTSTLIQSKENLIIKRRMNQLEVESGELVAEHSVEMNKIVTPRGGEYKLVLPDGTKVWLNADSYLEFPSKFSGAERKVKAGGELYFDVVSNKDLPFIVETNDLNLKVLGTEFNLRSYEDEKELISTLVEGRLNVYNRSGYFVELQPGFEATMDREDNSLYKRKADIEMATAWKEGRFYYDNVNLEYILKDISRWYDTEIVYQNVMVKKESFSVDIPKYEKIDDVLGLLQGTGMVSFSIKDRTIIVQ